MVSSADDLIIQTICIASCRIDNIFPQLYATYIELDSFQLWGMAKKNQVKVLLSKYSLFVVSMYES